MFRLRNLTHMSTHVVASAHDLGQMSTNADIRITPEILPLFNVFAGIGEQTRTGEMAEGVALNVRPETSTDVAKPL